jgi:hypothetical protein
LEEVLIVKKQTLILIALILIPLLAVAIAISPGSVMVFQNQTLTTISFAEPLEGVDFGWCAPVALILTYVLFAAVVIYALTKKQTEHMSRSVPQDLDICTVCGCGDIRIDKKAARSEDRPWCWICGHDPGCAAHHCKKRSVDCSQCVCGHAAGGTLADFSLHPEKYESETGRETQGQTAQSSLKNTYKL